MLIQLAGMKLSRTLTHAHSNLTILNLNKIGEYPLSAIKPAVYRRNGEITTKYPASVKARYR